MQNSYISNMEVPLWSKSDHYSVSYIQQNTKNLDLNSYGSNGCKIYVDIIAGENLL